MKKNNKAQTVEVNFYEILQVSTTATADEIKSAYHELAKIYHPDVNSDEAAAEQFSQIEQAYSVLIDDAKRTEYDLSLSQSTTALVAYDAATTALSTDVATANGAVSKKSAILKHFSAGNMAVMAILTALSFILYMFVKFPLPFMFPSFLDMQISDLPALLGGFALGPVEGCLIIIIKCCIKMPFTSTACVGELGDMVIGIANVLPASLIYRFHKNRKGALLGMLTGMLCAVVASLFMNWLVLIPFYAKAFGMDAIVGMMKSLYPDITADTVYNYYLPLAVLPFNILRCFVCALVTYFTYKPLSKVLHWEIKSKKKGAKADVATTQDQQETPTDTIEEQPIEQIEESKEQSEKRETIDK